MTNSDIIVFPGGELATNAFLLPCQDGTHLCIDAPPELMDFLSSQKQIKISALLLTHGHYDHVWDAALVEEAFRCPIYAHPIDFPMILDPSYLRQYGVPDVYPIPRKLEPLEVPLRASMKWTLHGHDFTLFHVPGHCPGSIAFYLPDSGMVFGGDVLFAGGLGRWDFPGCSRADLLNSLQTKFLTLPGPTVVYPGHGPSTTIAREMETNSYLR